MEGLSNNNVLSIAQDKQGYLWFATEEGLNKFDGVHFISYYKDIPDKLHITGNELNCLLDDPIDSILWIGTQRAGLNAYNYSNNTFTIYKHDPGDHNSLITDDVTSIKPASDGNLWITTYWNGIDYLDKKTGNLYIIIQKLYLDWGVIMYGQLLMGEMVICMWLMLFMDLV